MSKFVVITKVLDDHDMVVTEWTATHDINTAQGNLKGLLPRLRVIVRRELIARNLITPEPEDATRKR